MKFVTIMALNMQWRACNARQWLVLGGSRFYVSMRHIFSTMDTVDVLYIYIYIYTTSTVSIVEKM